VATNRRARFDYAILETVEAGLVLTGTEIKSVRQGKVDLRDAYARPLRQELWLENAHIAQYTEGNTQNHEPKRARKLLLHRRQIDDLSAQISQKGLTVVPLRLYIKGRVAKVLLGLAKGKRSYEKRDVLIERAVERETRREIKNMYR
jgi:SsrA-binding protein